MDAIRGQSCDVVKLLLSYGANPNVQEVTGKNCYHEAALSGNKQIINIIRDFGVNPLSRDKSGNTPFSIVMNKNVDVIKCVLGNNISITDSDGNSPIHIVVNSNGSTKLLEFLIEEGYPIDTRNSKGYTALNYAIEKNDLKMALILLQNGANPFQMIDKKGRNGVTIALEKNDKQMISNIVKYAGDMSDIQGNTILHYAAKTSSVETIQALLSYGIDKNVKNISGDTAYTIAVRWKRSELLNLLK
jgi:ankyrin repeat protein